MIRRALIADVKIIHQLIAERADQGHILARPMSELYSQLRDFVVDLDETTGDIVGCGAMQIVWEDLAEIRSLAVRTSHEGKGAGSRLIDSILREALEMGIQKVFVLTYRPGLFERFGFARMDKSELPHKIWADCIRCTKFPECDEIALVRTVE